MALRAAWISAVRLTELFLSSVPRVLIAVAKAEIFDLLLFLRRPLEAFEPVLIVVIVTGTLGELTRSLLEA